MVLAQKTTPGGIVQWFLPEHQGSVRDVIDNNGATINHALADVLRTVTPIEIANDFRICGYER